MEVMIKFYWLIYLAGIQAVYGDTISNWMYIYRSFERSVYRQLSRMQVPWQSACAHNDLLIRLFSSQKKSSLIYEDIGLNIAGIEWATVWSTWSTWDDRIIICMGVSTAIWWIKAMSRLESASECYLQLSTKHTWQGYPHVSNKLILFVFMVLE